MLPRSRFFSTLILTAFALRAAADDAPKPPLDFPGLKYRLLGPFTGGRATRATGLPGDPFTYYMTTASSGVWKSTDGGIRWKPIFDDMDVSSIGSLAIAPSDPNVIYVGSGEANIRGNVAAGNGIYKSTDAGKTWTHIWKQEGQIGTMVVHPKNPDIAFAAVLGHAFGPNPERGVYALIEAEKGGLFRSDDGGESFTLANPHRALRQRAWYYSTLTDELLAAISPLGVEASLEAIRQLENKDDGRRKAIAHQLPARRRFKVGSATTGKERSAWLGVSLQPRHFSRAKPRHKRPQSR